MVKISEIKFFRILRQINCIDILQNEKFKFASNSKQLRKPDEKPVQTNGSMVW